MHSIPVKQFPPADIQKFFDLITIEDDDGVGQYLSDGMSPNIVSASDKTALQAALFDGCVDIALQLIRVGADCKGPGILGGSLVHDASWSSILIRAVMDSGADPFAIDAAGYDTVYSAANNTSMKAIELLAEKGCPLDRRFDFDNGKMAIHAAAHHHDADVVATFVRLGVPATSVDDQGSTVIHYGVKSNYVSALNLSGSQADFIASMVSLGVDINAQDAHGCTALHYAAQMRNTSVARALIANGSGMDILNNQGKSALDLASAENKPILESLRAKVAVADLLDRMKPKKPHP